MLNEIYSEAKAAMEKSIESLKRDYQTLRTGKVNPAILDNVTVDYYGSKTGLAQVAQILTPDAITIKITPYEKNLIGAIEKAITVANIGVNPNNNGECVQLFFPPMTVDQRKESAKGAKVMTDNAKVAIRNIRKNSNDKVKKLQKDKVISDDETKKAEAEVQKITDSFILKADDTFKVKEAEILKV
ncbi:MAG: ribosome recycling factor [Arcobacteraceae bacterium]|jgi:ribosome recycling factor